MPAPCARRAAFNRLARGCGLTHPQAGRGRHAIYMVNRVSGEGNATPRVSPPTQQCVLDCVPRPSSNALDGAPLFLSFRFVIPSGPCPVRLRFRARSIEGSTRSDFLRRSRAKARGQPTPSRSTACRLKQSLTSISTRRDNHVTIGGYWNVSSPPYSVPTSSAIAASWGRTKRRHCALLPPTAS